MEKGIIRLEQEKDYFEVENLTREAFWNVYRPGCDEHFVLHNMRADARFVKELDYVIELDGIIVANIVYALGYLTLDNGEKRDILIFGPVSVLPQYQKQGFAERLINFTLEKAKALGYNCVAITGNPDYYKKYGFVSASTFGVYYEGMDKSDDAPFFMIKQLGDIPVQSGVYSDPECYHAREEDVALFDKQFPPKVKEKREGQLFN